MGNNLDDWKEKGFRLEDGKLIKGAPKSEKQKKPFNKYRNRKIVLDGITFDSEKEGRYYKRLFMLKKAKEIVDFKMQVKFSIDIDEAPIANYLLDFQVEHPDGTFEYIDIKAKDKKTQKWITTDVFKLKKKLVEAIYKIEIKLV